MNTHNTIYHTIKLANGGIVSMDKLAYEAYTGCGCSRYNHHWTHTLEFEGNEDERRIETAAIDINASTNIEMR